MALRLLFHDREGRLLEEVGGQAYCFWRLNEMGRADITLPITESKLRADLVRYGNLVKIEHESAGDWGGVLRVPETWTESEYTIRAITGEALLQDRVVGSRQTLVGCSGDIFEQIIQMANAVEDTRLRPDAIDRSGSVFSFDIEFESLWSALKRLRQFTWGEWAIEPGTDSDGGMCFDCSWYKRRGVQQSLTLHNTGKGANLALGGRILSTKREIANEITAVEQVAAEAERRHETRASEDSRALYGLRQSVVSVWAQEGATANLEAAALSELRRVQYQERLFALQAVESTVGDTFPFLGLGDRVGLSIMRVGFGIETTVRVLAKEFDDREGYMPLAVKEVIS
jgi:hypothetical protein